MKGCDISISNLGRQPIPSRYGELTIEALRGAAWVPGDIAINLFTLDETMYIVAELQAALPTPGGGAMIIDLFCGSGNFGHHLGQRLGHPVYASELNPFVYEATRNNLHRIGSAIELHRIDYRDLLGLLPARSERDTYIIELPGDRPSPQTAST